MLQSEVGDGGGTVRLQRDRVSAIRSVYELGGLCLRHRASAVRLCKARGNIRHSVYIASSPPVEGDESLHAAVEAARFAEALGVEVVLFKAKTRELYIRYGKPFLDAIESAGLRVVPVLQNHRGSAITTLKDFREVLDGIGDDRMKTLLEVGHFHSVGVSWREGYELLGDSIALVHIKDQIGARSVPFGRGEIDLPGLFAFMEKVGYRGKFVVEMEVEDRENTMNYLKDALAFVRGCGL